MGCGNDTTFNVMIPVITISKSGGDELKKSMASGAEGNSPLFNLVKIYLSKHFREMLLGS